MLKIFVKPFFAVIICLSLEPLCYCLLYKENYIISVKEKGQKSMMLYVLIMILIDTCVK